MGLYVVSIAKLQRVFYEYELEYFSLILGKYRGFFLRGRGGGTPRYKPYRYVPHQREEFLPRGDTPDFKGRE